MIIDTCFLIDVMDDDSGALGKLSELEKNETLKISAISIFELFQGIARANDKELKKVQGVLSHKNLVPLGRNEAEQAGLARGNFAKKGKTIGVGDAMIAGTALANNETLLTRNAKDFKNIDGLKIEEY